MSCHLENNLFARASLRDECFGWPWILNSDQNKFVLRGMTTYDVRPKSTHAYPLNLKNIKGPCEQGSKLHYQYALYAHHWDWQCFWVRSAKGSCQKPATVMYNQNSRSFPASRAVRPFHIHKRQVSSHHNSRRANWLSSSVSSGDSYFGQSVGYYSCIRSISVASLESPFNFRAPVENVTDR